MALLGASAGCSGAYGGEETDPGRCRWKRCPRRVGGVRVGRSARCLRSWLTAVLACTRAGGRGRKEGERAAAPLAQRCLPRRVARDLDFGQITRVVRWLSSFDPSPITAVLTTPPPAQRWPLSSQANSTATPLSSSELLSPQQSRLPTISTRVSMSPGAFSLSFPSPEPQIDRIAQLERL